MELLTKVTGLFIVFLGAYIAGHTDANSMGFGWWSPVISLLAGIGAYIVLKNV